MALAPADRGPIAAGSGDPVQAEALATELSHDLMSPYCPGRTIATCPSPQARKLEHHILEQAQQGKSRVEIETALAERFPDIRGYVGRPEIIYGTALLAVIAMIGLVMVGRRWVRQTRARAGIAGGAAQAPAAGLSTDLDPVRPGGDAAAAGKPSRREVDALDDALDRIDEF
jgi:cytochrome c-type biogenesis protein CcmH/NrfF